MKVRCVESAHRGFKVGKIYEINKKIKDDDGFQWGNHSKYYIGNDLERFNKAYWSDKSNLKIAKFEKVEEITMTNTEKIADLEKRQREIADKIKVIRERVDFTLDGFLRGDFAISFKENLDKYMFLGYLQGKTDLKWSCGGERPLEFIPYDKVLVRDGKLFQGAYPPIKEIPFLPSILTETPQNHAAELHALETEQRQIADEMAALKKEMEKTEGYKKPERGDKYWFIDVNNDGVQIDFFEWNDDGYDNCRYATGNCYPTEPEAQRVADMLNYFFLAQRKAREMGGYIGCAWKQKCVPLYALCMSSSGKLKYENVNEYRGFPPLQPLMTRLCAETLAKDLEIITAAKKAWGVK